MDKKYCDVCKKEIEEMIHLYGSKWSFYGIISKWVSKDFCSVKCLKKFVEGL